MAKFLLDANLPYFFSLWNNKDFIHLNDIVDNLPDSEVWNYARNKGLTIVTKDADFSNRIILSEPPPKVIHLRIGNLKISEFHALISKIWKDIEAMSEEHKLLNVYVDRIEGIQ